MAKMENPPFPRGDTYYGPDRTIDTADLDTKLEGMEWEFEDLDYSVTGAKPSRTGRLVKCRLVRNVSGIPLLPKRCVTYQKSAGNYYKRVDGYSTITADSVAGVVDEWLPTAGVRNNDLFWMVVEGPTECLNDLDAVTGTRIDVGNLLIALTAVTSQATTAGRVRAVNPTAASTFTELTGLTVSEANTTDGTALAIAANIIGRALSARTSANTNSGVLVALKQRW